MTALSRPPEKRLRLRRREDVDPGVAKINPETAKFLQITDMLEVVIAGKKRYTFKAIGFGDVPANEVWCNADELRARGIADNTIATVRRPLHLQKS